MLDDLFKTTLSVARHRSTILGPYLDEYLGKLKSVGYKDPILRRDLFVITRFGEYLAKRRVQQLSDITPKHVAAFRKRERVRLRGCSKAPKQLLANATRIVEGFLCGIDVLVSVEAETETSTGVMTDFYQWLEVDRGLQAVTINGYRHFIDLLICHMGSDGSRESLSKLTLEQVDAFIVSTGRTRGRKSISQACSAIRALLRYLYRARVLDHDLSLSVIMPKFYALERLPTALPWETVLEVLKAVDVGTALGRRDRAILLLLVTYGVRPGEVVKLRLDDIDWRHETILFPRAKNGRSLSFPLTRDVGEAILAYLADGRPPTTVREIFVRSKAPHVGFGCGSAVSLLVCKYLTRAGIKSRLMGAYLIRHSLAVHLLRQLHPLKTITDMLGHRDPRIAFHYTKLGLEDLQGVALDAKEVLP